MTRIARISAFFTLLFAGAAFAQTAPATTGLQFAVATSASNVHLNGVNIPTAVVQESFAVVKSSYGMWYAQMQQASSTDQSFNALLFGIQLTPNWDDWLSTHTLLPKNTLQPSFSVSPGIIRNSAGRNAIGGEACGNLDYSPTSNGVFNVSVLHGCVLSASGFGPKPYGYELKSGISVNFGGTK